MIASRKDKAADIKDNFSHLGNYLADTTGRNEKLKALWIETCHAGATLADLPDALIEIESTRALKPGVDNKTYHLVLSFRESDLPEEVLKDIEQHFAQALGYGDHQRVVAAHTNTDHFHLHVAINKVHPETLRVHTPFNDYFTLEKVARAMEQKHGLAPDLGLSDYRGQDHEKTSQKAKDFEAHRWQQSFHGYMRETKAGVLETIAGAKDWPGLHKALAEGYGVALHKRGNGLVFRPLDPETGDPGKQAMKASLLDRSLSKAHLEKRLGAYQAPAEKEKAQAPAPLARPKRHYQAKPLTRHPATSALWRKYTGARPPLRSSFLGRLAAGWKTYLFSEAYQDPLALVLVIAHREFLEMLVGGSTPQQNTRPAPLPKPLNPVLAHWRATGRWAQRDNPLVKGQGLPGHGVRQDEEGNLVIPLRDGEGHIQALRLVKEGGESLDIGDTSQPGLRHTIDPNERLGTGPVLVTASLADAAALHRATGLPVVLVPEASTAEATAQALAAAHPNSRPLVAPALGEDRSPPTVRSALAEGLGDKPWQAWEGASEWANPGNSAWLHEAGVRGFGVKITDSGDLVIPLKPLHGPLQAVQTISPEGQTATLSGPLADGSPLMHLIDPQRQARHGGPLLLASTYTDAAALHQATRLPVALVPDPAHLGPMIEALQDQQPDRKLILATATASETVPEGVTHAATASPADHAKARTFDDLRAALAPSTEDRVWLAWQAATPANPDHPDPATRKDQDGNDLVPLRDAGGHLWGLHRLGPDGSPIEALAQGSLQDLFHILGPRHAMKGAGAEVEIIDDYQQALARHKATGKPVAYVPDGGKEAVQTVRAVLERRWPGKAMIRQKEAGRGWSTLTCACLMLIPAFMRRRSHCTPRHLWRAVTVVGSSTAWS